MAINESQKWPTNKVEYDRNYLRCHGERCEVCSGRGFHEDKVPNMKKRVRTTCIICGGIGFTEKQK